MLRFPTATSARVLVMINDKHFRDGASAALRARKRFVVDHHVGGERVKRRRVRVDQHRVGGANRLQVGSRLAGDVELIEEAHEAALGAIGARIGRGLVGEANLANKIDEAARRAGDLRAVQRVGADAVRRAGLAALARKEQGSRPEQVSGRRCTSPHGGRQMSGVGCDICQWMTYHGGSE